LGFCPQGGGGHREEVPADGIYARGLGLGFRMDGRERFGAAWDASRGASAVGGGAMVRPGARCAAVSHPLAYVTGKKGEQRQLPGGSHASVKEERRKSGGA
jgi:hypothetical protein